MSGWEQTSQFNSACASAAKPGVEQEHNALLNERYDLSDRPAQGVTIDRAKPVQEGVRVKLPAGVTWESLAAMSPDQIREQNLFPKGFYPLPHPKHPEGGFVFLHFIIDAIKQQDGRDLKRFDIDFDLPDHFLAEFPPAIYLTPRPEIGDVSQGKLVSLTKLLPAIQRPPHSPPAGRVASATDAVSAATVQRNRGSPRRASEQGQLALIATRTAIKVARHTWLQIPDRSNSAIASKPSRYAA